MSKGLNKVMLIGNLGKDPELKYTQSGIAVVSFSVAINESYKDKDDKQVEKTEWVNVSAWRKLAEICGQYLKKGSKVYLEGKLSTREYEKDGVKKYFTEVIADQMIMLGGKNGGEAADQPTAAVVMDAFAEEPKKNNAVSYSTPADKDMPF